MQILTTKPDLGELQFVVSAPARMNLIGEHTDYNGGKVLPFAVENKLVLKCYQSVEPAKISIWSNTTNGGLQIDPKNPDFSYDQKTPQFLKFLIGCVSVLPIKKSTTIEIDSDIPLGAGVSSSAALCCGILSVLDRLSEKNLSKLEIAKLAQKVEHEFVGTKCGLMDQLAILNSKAQAFTAIDFRNTDPKITTVSEHSIFENYFAVAFQTGVKHNLSDSPYNERRESCELALDLLNSHFKKNYHTLGEYSYADCFPFRLSLETEPQLMNLLSNEVGLQESEVKRSTHAILENLRVDLAIHALEEGDPKLLSRCMQESHRSLRDLYEVSCQELEVARIEVTNWALRYGQNHSSQLPVVLGPRLCGGGFGGSTIQLILKDAWSDFKRTFEAPQNAYKSETGYSCKVWKTEISEGLSIS